LGAECSDSGIRAPTYIAVLFEDFSWFTNFNIINVMCSSTCSNETFVYLTAKHGVLYRNYEHLANHDVDLDEKRNHKHSFTVSMSEVLILSIFTSSCMLVRMKTNPILNKPECVFSHVTSVLAIHVSCIVLGTLRTTMTWNASFL
jgi:hypothetical protein